MSEGIVVRLIRDGNAIGAILGTSYDLQANPSGWGDTAPEALRALASAIEKENPPMPELDATNTPRKEVTAIDRYAAGQRKKLTKR